MSIKTPPKKAKIAICGDWAIAYNAPPKKAEVDIWVRMSIYIVPHLLNIASTIVGLLVEQKPKITAIILKTRQYSHLFF